MDDARPPLSSRALAVAGLVGIYAAGVGYVLTPFAACPIATNFHVPCPGCGSTRAVLALAHGHVAAALAHNAAAPAIALLSALIALRSLVVTARLGWGAVGHDRWILRFARGLIALWGLQIVLWGARALGLFGGPEPI